MNNKFEQKEKSPREKALEIVPAIIGSICLIIGMAVEDYTLKLIFLFIAAGIGVIVFLFLLIREIVNRIKKRRN